VAVLIDIWVRQTNLVGRLRQTLFRRKPPQGTVAHA
jgi:hypothetical protein